MYRLNIYHFLFQLKFIHFSFSIIFSMNGIAPIVNLYAQLFAIDSKLIRKMNYFPFEQNIYGKNTLMTT